MLTFTTIYYIQCILYIGILFSCGFVNTFSFHKKKSAFISSIFIVCIKLCSKYIFNGIYDLVLTFLIYFFLKKSTILFNIVVYLNEMNVSK